MLVEAAVEEIVPSIQFGRYLMIGASRILFFAHHQIQGIHSGWISGALFKGVGEKTDSVASDLLSGDIIPNGGIRLGRAFNYGYSITSIKTYIIYKPS